MSIAKATGFTLRSLKSNLLVEKQIISSSIKIVVNFGSKTCPLYTTVSSLYVNQFARLKTHNPDKVSIEYKDTEDKCSIMINETELELDQKSSAIQILSQIILKYKLT